MGSAASWRTADVYDLTLVTADERLLHGKRFRGAGKPLTFPRTS
jgi:hypothetical protein